MAPAIGGVAATPDVPEILELVQYEDDVVCVDAENLRELLLWRAVVVAQVAQRDEQAQVHAEQLLAASLVDLLGQPGEENHRPRSACSLIPHNVASIPQSRLEYVILL